MKPSEKLKILIVTDSAVLPSGMAETTRLIFGNLLARHRAEYDIQQIGLFHCYAVTEPQWTIHPTLMTRDRSGNFQFAPDDQYAQKTFFRLLPKLQPDIVFAFGDPQRVLHLCQPANQRRHKLILYINFDGLPLPP